MKNLLFLSIFILSSCTLSIDNRPSISRQEKIDAIKNSKYRISLNENRAVFCKEMEIDSIKKECQITLSDCITLDSSLLNSFSEKIDKVICAKNIEVIKNKE